MKTFAAGPRAAVSPFELANWVVELPMAKIPPDGAKDIGVPKIVIGDEPGSTDKLPTSKPVGLAVNV